MIEEKRQLRVFLCHAHKDEDRVRDLYLRLKNDGVDAWLDKENLIPGSDWEHEIRKAVRESDVVIVCLSKQFNERGFRQNEVRIALKEADSMPDGEIFIIPARLEECENLDSLQKWHWVDLFDDRGYERLIGALHVRADKIGAVLQSKKGWLPKLTPSLSRNEKSSFPIAASNQKAISKVLKDKLSAPSESKNKKGKVTPSIMVIVGMIIALVLGLLLIEKIPFLNGVLNTIENISVTEAQTAKPTITIQPRTITPTVTAITKTPQVLISPSATRPSVTVPSTLIGRWSVWYQYSCYGNAESSAYKVYTIDIKNDGTYLRNSIVTEINKQGAGTEKLDGEKYGKWEFANDEIKLISGNEMLVGTLSENKIKYGLVYLNGNQVWLECWTAEFVRK